MTGKMARGGFTLIETLVTLLIVGVLLSLLYGVLVSTLRSKKKLEDLSSREKIRTGIVRLFAQDIRGVYTYSLGGPSSPSRETPETPQQSADGLPRIAGSFEGKDGGDLDTLSFLSSRDEEGTEETAPSSFSRVHYAHQPGEERGLHTLFRGVEPDSPEAGMVSDAAYAEVYDRIVLFDLEYLGATDWLKEWTAPEPPNAIRLTLQIRLEGEDEEKELPPFVTVFTIPSS